ncbi:MAG TPA: PrpF domain-containing protein [Dehalococcoidales bacterium]
MGDFRRIPCVIQRAGTSKGVYFHEKDLPENPKLREKVILSVFGSPDIRQIDGLGGADPLTSKVAIIGPSKRNDADVNYTMGQVSIVDALVDFSGNCGNISSGVGPFAIDEGLVTVKEPQTVVRIYNTNTKKILKSYVATFGGKSKYTGDYAIDGVPGTGSKILLDYSETSGTLGKGVLPTGKPVDLISFPGIGKAEVSIVDVGNPACFFQAESLGFSGTEGPVDPKVIESLESIELIRGTVSKLLGLATDAAKARFESPTRPLIIYVSKPTGYTSFTDGAHIQSADIDLIARSYFMQTMHKTYPGTGAVCTGAAAMIEGTIVNRVCSAKARETKIVRIGHPSGTMPAEVDVENSPQGPVVKLVAFGRTSRRIMEGFVYVPERVFQDSR